MGQILTTGGKSKRRRKTKTWTSSAAGTDQEENEAYHFVFLFNHPVSETLSRAEVLPNLPSEDREWTNFEQAKGQSGCSTMIEQGVRSNWWLSARM